MKLYELGTLAGIDLFVFGRKQPKLLNAESRRIVAGFRVSEQQNALYLAPAHGKPQLVRGDRVVIFFGTETGSHLAIKGAEHCFKARGLCAILTRGAKFVIYSTRRNDAWDGTAGDIKVSRGIHPDTEEV